MGAAPISGGPAEEFAADSDGRWGYYCQPRGGRATHRRVSKKVMISQQRVGFATLLVVLSVLYPMAAAGDVGLLAYPLNYVVFRYAPAEYAVIEPVDPQYDPAYGVAGHMLWNRLEQRVALEVYRTPGLSGFETSSSGRSEFYTAGNTATICVDGFSNYPRQLNDIYVEFRPYPASSAPDIFIDGERIEGLQYVIPRLVVTTPVGDGYYADTVTFRLRWVGAQFIRIVVYADKNGNRVFDGDPSYSILMEDLTVPVESKTWGNIKILYGDN